MDEIRYPISEAAKLTQVDAHVLRYWEEELGLTISRNEMGHRYYTEKDIQTFLEIKELKREGMQLRSIREKLRNEQESRGLPRVIIMKPKSLRENENVAKSTAAAEKTQTKGSQPSPEDEFLEIMDRLVREIRRNERKEGRYRRLDEAIRRHQQSRRLVAVTQEKGRNRRKNRLKKEK